MKNEIKLIFLMLYDKWSKNKANYIKCSKDLFQSVSQITFVSFKPKISKPITFLESFMLNFEWNYTNGRLASYVVVNN